MLMEELKPEPVVIDTSKPDGAVTIIFPIAGVKFEPFMVNVDSADVACMGTFPKATEDELTVSNGVMLSPLTGTF